MYQKMQEEYLRLTKELQEVNKVLGTFPEGKLICAWGGDGYRWYNSDGHHKVYIPRKQRAVAQRLAVKKYYALRKAELESEITAIKFYLRHHTEECQEAVQRLWEHPGYQELLKTQVLPLSEELAIWRQFPYERNPHYTEGLIHKTASGDWVRSKSEAMIAHFLYTNGIPFRYECALQLGEITIYPDFTIRHPRTGRQYYWEHFGRMDDPAYAKNASMKLQQYIAHEMIPSIQLITTYETKDTPLTIDQIESIVRQYFL